VVQGLLQKDIRFNLAELISVPVASRMLVDQWTAIVDAVRQRNPLLARQAATTHAGFFRETFNQAQRAQTRIQRDEIRTELQRQTSSFEEAEVSAQKTLDRLKQSQEVAQAAWDAAKLALSETQAQHTHGTATDLELLDAQVLEAKSALLVRQLALQQRLATWQWRYVRGETLKFAGE